jgi:hypothetical protein
LKEVKWLNWLGRESGPRPNPTKPSTVPKLDVSLFIHPKRKFEIPS